MTITTRQDKVNATLEKLQARLQKYTSGYLEKKYAKLDEKKRNNYIKYDINALLEQIEDNRYKLQKAIEADKREEERTSKKMNKEQREAAILADLPQSLLSFADLVYEETIKNEVNRYEYYSKLPRPNYRDYSPEARTIRYYKDQFDLEKVKKDTKVQVKNLLLNLMDRVTKKIGKVVNASHLSLEAGNFYEGTAINGYLEGENGCCDVYSITAGGYNIQRLHVRVLVK